MTPKNNKTRFPYYIKLCVSFQIHQWIQTGVTVRKCPIWVKFDDFFSRVTLQFDVWPWTTTGHLFHATSSYVHHFVAIGEFKLELQSGNAQSGSNSMIFFSRVTLQFDVWPWTTTGHLFHATSSYVHHFVAIGEFTSSKQNQALCIISSWYVNSNWSYSPGTVKLGCELCDLDLWPLTFCTDITSVICNNSWKILDDTIMGT